MSVALDAMILIWGMRQGNPRQGDLQYRAGVLIEQLSQDKEDIVIPTVAVGELLMGIDPAKHGDFLVTLRKRYFCPPFDLRASAIAAGLWHAHRQLPKSDQIERRVLRADVMILATAAAAGVSTVYSHDEKFRRFADAAGLNAQDLPTHHLDMHVDNEMRKEFGLKLRCEE